MARPVPLQDLPPSVTSSARYALFAKGFRPFFLLAALSAAVMLPLWLLVLRGAFSPATHFDPVSWHAHEMVFGFTVAVIAGFLLTAVGNWTQRETAVGMPLGLLSALWLAGRVAMSSSVLRPGLVAAVDLAFLPALMIVLSRPLIAASNRRNYVMLGVLAALFATNVMTHLGALDRAFGWQRRGALVAIDVVVLLMIFVAGRVIPMFTRNATKREGIRSLPKLDALAVAAMAALTAVDALMKPPPVIVAVISGAAAVVVAARAVRWGAQHTLGHPLLWILHVGYLWIPVGLALRAAGAVDVGVWSLMATHAITAGAIGSLTLGMMARVSLGHTGRPITASRVVALSFVMITLGAVARVGAPLVPEHYLTALSVAGGLWAAAFVVYVIAYAKLLVTPRADGRAG